MIDFVIPSMGRSTLNRTLNSIIDQNFLFSEDKSWKAYVGFDGISEEEIDKTKLVQNEDVEYLFFPKKIGSISEYGIGNAGEVRNEIIKKVNSSNEWIGFLDDDDTITRYYMDSLAIEIQKYKDEPFDVCVFRMRGDISGNNIIPPLDLQEIEKEKVGISFCVKKNYLLGKNIKFSNSNYEDYEYLMQLKKSGAKVVISNYVTYNVGF